MKPKIIAVVGPTASGKSEYAVKLARKIGGEIISADSRQVYRGLNVGSGKIIKKEMGGIPHYGLDIASPKKRFTVQEYKKYADLKIAEILARGKMPILVGGTGFYIQAVTENLNMPDVAPNPRLRKKLEKRSAETLFKILQKKDPARAKTIERKNKRRLVRALEIIAALGRVPEIRKEQKYATKFVGIKRAPKELKSRIEKRITRMLDPPAGGGLVRETKKLKTSSLSWKRIYELGFEYKYPALFLQKKISKVEMRQKLISESIDYARRQMVWFKKDKRIRWITPKS